MSDQRNYRSYTNQGRNYHRTDSPPKLPDDYLVDGYFDQYGIPFKELFVDWPEKIAMSLKYKNQNLAQSSIRRIFNEVKTIAGLAQADEAGFQKHLKRLHMLKSRVHYAVQRNENLPRLIMDFVNKNYPQAQKSRQHLMVFAEHFECVIGYLK